ncbi:MAG: hypothetical protein K2O09_08370 [Treponemataceae bacterium]|nr:hypothetical protein [Treponemataceae bacterium]
MKFVRATFRIVRKAENRLGNIPHRAERGKSLRVLIRIVRKAENRLGNVPHRAEG